MSIKENSGLNYRFLDETMDVFVTIEMRDRESHLNRSRRYLKYLKLKVFLLKLFQNIKFTNIRENFLFLIR